MKHNWWEQAQRPSFKLLSYASSLIFFWAIFDGIISYVTPLVITQKGFSKTTMGLIYSTSSVAGAIFDFILSKFLKNTHFRRVFLIMFALCAGYPFLLWKAQGIFMFIIAMAIWGLYYDLMNFGFYDFISRKSKIEDHCTNFGIIEIFKCSGYLIAPLLAGALIGSLVIDYKPFTLASLFLLISFVFYLRLLQIERKQKSQVVEQVSFKRVNVFKELGIWEKIGLVIFPVLVFTALLSMFDAFFWTLGPLFSESFPTFKDFGGLLMTAYTFPMLVTGWFVGKFTRKFGKKRTAFAATLISSVFLLPLPLCKNPYLLLAMVLVSSFTGSLAWPAIKGAYADYITETFKYEKEIEGLGDFATNFGYVLGPILAGFLADKVGNTNTFSFLGLAGIATTIILLYVTPKKITVPQRT